MVRTCKVKLGRAYKQESRLVFVLTLCRHLYNAALQQRIEAYRKQGVSLSLYDQQKELTQLRSDDEDYRSLTATMTRLTSLKRLDEAFKGFFRRIKRGEKPGFPRFKGRDRFDTLTFDKKGWKIEGKKLVIRVGLDKPIILTMRNTIHREGEIQGLRLVKRANRWWAHFLVEIGEAPATKPSKKSVGIDVGIRTFATLSDGEQIEHPHFLKKSQVQLKEAQQIVSRKKKGSNNRAKAKLSLSRIHEKIKNRRSNFIFQTVATLVANYDGFAVEKLNIKEMSSSKKQPKEMGKKGARTLRRNIMDSAWLAFANQLGNKAEEAGFPIVKVDPRGTSKTCSVCGYVMKELPLSIREWTCPGCGTVHDRDENASKNILNRARNNLGCRLVAGGTISNCAEGAEVPS